MQANVADVAALQSANQELAGRVDVLAVRVGEVEATALDTNTTVHEIKQLFTQRGV